MKRFEDWQTRLGRFLETHRDTPFAYGDHDCCLFAADAILAMTGIDVAASFRNSYRTGFGAIRRMIRSTGHHDVEPVANIVFESFGIFPVSLASAGRGDALLLEMPAGGILGLVSLNGSIVAAAERGYIELPRGIMRKAWRI